MQVDAAYWGPGAFQTAGIRGRGGLELDRENDWPVIFLLLVLNFFVPTQARPASLTCPSNERRYVVKPGMLPRLANHLTVQLSQHSVKAGTSVGSELLGKYLIAETGVLEKKACRLNWVHMPPPSPFYNVGENLRTLSAHVQRNKSLSMQTLRLCVFVNIALGAGGAGRQALAKKTHRLFFLEHRYPMTT